MSYQISDLDELNIYITYDDGEWIVPKFRIYMVVDEPICYLNWTDTEKGTGGFTRRLALDYNDVQFGYLTPTSASEVKQVIEGYIISAFPNLSGYVPYTGAINNVDLGIYGLTADYVAFDLNPVAAAGAGQIVYDGQTGSLTYLLNNSLVPSHIGQTLHAYVHNAEAVQINKGEAVYLYQATGNKASVKLAYNTSDATSAKTFGLAAEDIAAGGQGMVITVGQLQGVNTAAFSEGDTLYLGATAGTYTNVKPYAPNHLVYIGIVEKANANGEIYVRVQNGYELDEIHDVDLITTPPISGDVLTYNGSLWVAQAPTGGSGITSLNSQTGTTQTFATGTTGTDFNISSATNTHTFNIPTASATNRGLLSTTDWSTFNSKFTLPALTSGSVLFSNGTTIAQDNANLFWDDTNNRLGIRTNAPAYNLDINGTCRITSTVSNGLLIEGTNPYTPGSDYITINGTGNTGITLKTNTSGFCAHRFFFGSTELGVFYVGETNREFVFKNSTTGFIDFQTTNLNTSRLRILNNGRVLINTTTDAGFQFDVNGTGRIAGDTTISGNITATKSQNANSRIEIINTTAGTTSLAEFKATSNAGYSFQFGKTSTSYTTYKTLVAGDGYIYNNGNGGSISILNDFASGTIKFTAGGSSTVHWTINSNGNLEANNAINMVFGTTTGTKIGTATTQKIGFWNATPIVQPTTAVAGATFAAVAGGSTIDTNDTFDGYTVGQVVKALRNLGILA